MVGPAPARDDEAARLTGARGDFVSSLGRRVDALRVVLRAVEQSPGDSALRNGLLRRIHALSSAARVLGFASVAEALTETEKRLRHSEFADVARSLDLLPSLLMGVPPSLRPPELRAERAPAHFPLSVLVFGAQALADVILAIPGTHVECERTEDPTRAREQMRSFAPDLAVIDADRAGARELVAAFAEDRRVDPVPLVVVGDFTSPEAASAFIALGALRVLSKPVSAEVLRGTVVDLRALGAEPRPAREPLGELSVEELAERIAAEIRRGLLDSVEPSARDTSVSFGTGADVMAAVWGTVTRVRELTTLHSSGAVRFDATGPEGAVPVVAWANEERRAGERAAGVSETRSGDGVSLQGRRVVVADDDPAVVWFMSGLLRTLGVEVLEAHDGARALALTYESWPDLVVSDVLMPKLDGFSLCHEIKRDIAVRDVPVILLSWKEDLLQRLRELGASADGYLRKEAAASTVAERLREVLRPRARVEQRIAAGGDARGRLDGLTPRLILGLAATGERDVRVGIRDAVYLYEVQIRRGRLCSATRSAADGSFERGEAVLAALLGVNAGRFSVEPDSAPCRVDFEGSVAQVLGPPIERAREALRSLSESQLLGVTRVLVTTPIIDGYLACTPEPARGLLDKIIGGASPRELLTSGTVSPRLLEAVLSDVARRGAISKIEREGTASLSPPPSAPPEPLPLAAGSREELSVGAELPASARPSEVDTLPFNSDVTPSADRLLHRLTEGVFSQPQTLQGVGLPDVSSIAGEPVREPAPVPASSGELEPAASSKADDLDVLADALTQGSPSPAPVLPESRPAPGPGSAPPLRESQPARVSTSGVSPLKVSLSPPPTLASPAHMGSGWLLRLLLVAGLAFAVAYALVTFLRMQSTPEPLSPAPGSAPATH